MLLLKFTDYAVLDMIELTETESEEVEETEFDEFLVNANKLIQQNKTNISRYNNSNLIVFNYYLDVFTPPPENIA